MSPSFWSVGRYSCPPYLGGGPFRPLQNAGGEFNSSTLQLFIDVPESRKLGVQKPAGFHVLDRDAGM